MRLSLLLTCSLVVLSHHGAAGDERPANLQGSVDIQRVAGQINPSLYQCPNGCYLPELPLTCSTEKTTDFSITFPPAPSREECLRELVEREDDYCSFRGDMLPCCAHNNAASCLTGTFNNICTCNGSARFQYYQQCDGRDNDHNSNRSTTTHCCATFCPNPPSNTADVDQECHEHGCYSPILVDLGRPGFDLTASSEGVRFDLDGDGTLESTAWTAPGAGEGFLALDRNNDGAIGDGTELFGNSTPQQSSESPNGYEALALFDLPVMGGDADGRVTAADAVFPALRIWVDTNHDGISQAEELRPLSHHGIIAISLDYRESRRRDRHGNAFRYAGNVDLTGKPPRTKSVDVFFAVE